mmetsp:Transcript_73287/g.238425  ORF Transcript_73287/g.238425 Transcript_73287/m.238425 type:complete len:675 (+) Transcript_73287:115-2139(+)
MPSSAADDDEGRSSVARPLVDALLLWLPPLLCACVYLPSIQYSEWYIDELFAVLRNEDARGETPLQQVFANDFWGNSLRSGWTHKSFRPLSVLSFAWQFRLLEPGLFRPQPLRAFNIALHAANTMLVLALLRQLRISRFWSRVGACLFAAHPVHVESVVYLVGRADCLATMGWLLAALLQLRVHAARPRCAPPRPLASLLLLLAAAALAVLAGLCKESGLTLLVFTAGVELCTAWRAPGSQRRSVAMAVAALVLFALLAHARFEITQGASAAFGFVDTPVQYNSDRWVRTWSYLFQHAVYAKLLVLPGHLSWDYSFDAIPLLRAGARDARALTVCAAYLALAALAAWSLAPGRGRRRLLLGLQVVIVPFVPCSNLFFTVGVTVGERLLYPSTVGAALAAAALGEAAEGRSRRQRRDGGGLAGAAARWLGSALVLVYLHGCTLRVWQWRSSEALYEADAIAWPTSVKTQHQVGTVYHAQNRLDEALQHYNASLLILDDNALTDHCVAQIFIETGRFAMAAERFEKIFRGHGVGFSQFNLYMLYIDYGFALVSLARFEEAIPSLQTGLNKNMAVPHGLNAMGYAYTSLNMLQEAQDAFAKGLEYDPDNAVLWSNLAVVWMAGGALQQAAQGLEKALQLEPDNPAALQNAQLLQDAVENGGYVAARPRLELFFTRMM